MPQVLVVPSPKLLCSDLATLTFALLPLGTYKHIKAKAKMRSCECESANLWRRKCELRCYGEVAKVPRCVGEAQSRYRSFAIFPYLKDNFSCIKWNLRQKTNFLRIYFQPPVQIEIFSKEGGGIIVFAKRGWAEAYFW